MVTVAYAKICNCFPVIVKHSALSAERESHLSDISDLYVSKFILVASEISKRGPWTVRNSEWTGCSVPGDKQTVRL